MGALLGTWGGPGCQGGSGGVPNGVGAGGLPHPGVGFAPGFAACTPGEAACPLLESGVKVSSGISTGGAGCAAQDEARNGGSSGCAGPEVGLGAGLTLRGGMGSGRAAVTTREERAVSGVGAGPTTEEPCRRVPQSPQKRAPRGSREAQFGQVMVSSAFAALAAWLSCGSFSMVACSQIAALALAVGGAVG